MESLNKLPETTRRAARRLAFSRKTLQTIAQEWLALEQSAAEVRATGTLGDRPLVVLRHGLTGPTAPGVSKELAMEIEQLAMAVQEDLARLSSRGTLVTGDQGGHDIHIDQPELVAHAIRQAVELVRLERSARR